MTANNNIGGFRLPVLQGILPFIAAQVPSESSPASPSRPWRSPK